MDIERKLKKQLSNYADSIECPEQAYFKTRNLYINNVIKKGEQKFMEKKKKFMLNTVALAIAVILPVGALAGSHVIEAFKTVTIQEENVDMKLSEYLPDSSNLTSVQRTALNKAYTAFPELKEFDITGINAGEGRVDYETMNWSSIELEKDGLEFVLDIDNVTGEFYYFGRYNWDKNYNEMSKEDIVLQAKAMIGSIYSDIDSYSYEFKDFYGKLPNEKLQGAEKQGINIDTNKECLEFSKEDSDIYFRADYSEDGQLAIRVLNK
jgi:ribosomal protein S19